MELNNVNGGLEGVRMIRLKAERLKKGWTQQVLGFHADVPIADISRIEGGWMRPYPGHAARLARALGLKPDELLERVETGPEELTRHP
jgi:transcriptional regulator with XRE-family HTH domain